MDEPIATDNPYTPPAADLLGTEAPTGSPEVRIPLYTPTQVRVVTFFFGPLAGLVLLRSTLLGMAEPVKARWVVLYGTCICLLTVLSLPLLPEHFPPYVIPLIHMSLASFVATKWLPGPEQIATSGRFKRHSSWRAAGIGLVGFVIFLIPCFASVLLFSALSGS